MDLSEFKLQYCRGAVKSDESAAFVDAYQGPMTCYTLRHLKPNTTYTFRVCGLAEGTETWGPWSVPISASTLLRHYGGLSFVVWPKCNSLYLIHCKRPRFELPVTF